MKLSGESLVARRLVARALRRPPLASLSMILRVLTCMVFVVTVASQSEVGDANFQPELATPAPPAAPALSPPMKQDGIDIQSGNGTNDQAETASAVQTDPELLADSPDSGNSVPVPACNDNASQADAIDPVVVSDEAVEPVSATAAAQVQNVLELAPVDVTSAPVQSAVDPLINENQVKRAEPVEASPETASPAPDLGVATSVEVPPPDNDAANATVRSSTATDDSTNPSAETPPASVDAPSSTPVPQPAGPSLPELTKAVDKCNLLKKKTAAQAEECADATAQLAAARRASKWEKQRSDGLEAHRRRCEGGRGECMPTERMWSPASLRVPGETPSYQEFLLHYGIDYRPAVLPAKPLLSDLSRDVLSPLRACGEAGCGLRAKTRPPHVPSASEWAVLSALYSLSAAVNVPFFATGDYLQRLGPAADAAAKGGDPLAQPALKDVQLQWPAVYSSPHVSLHVSPLGLHRFILPVVGTLAVRIVNEEQTGYFYPHPNGTFPSDVDVFHPDVSKYPALTLVSGIESHVGVGQVLFVPSGSAVSWHTVGPDGIALTDDSATVDPEHVPIVVEHCFVDASNLNRVKAELKVSSLKASKLASLLSMLQSPLLDTTLARRADDMAFPVFSAWPRPTPDPTASSPDSGADGDADTPAAATGKRRMAGTSMKNRPNRANRLKDWQEDRKWSLKIRQLSMPAPSTPLIHAVGRRNVTVMWHCPSEGGAPHSHTGGGESDSMLGLPENPVKGFALVWHAQSLGPEISRGGGEVKSSGEEVRDFLQGIGVPSHNHTTEEVLEDMDMSLHSLLDFDVSSGVELMYADKPSKLVIGCGGISADVVCTTIPNLLPNHIYVFRVAAITEIGKSTFSESSPTARTDYLRTPAPPVSVEASVRGAATISLRVVPPVDDGGLPILGYVIIRQENWLGNYSEAVVALANHDRLDIIGLVPATGYRFRVAAVNAAGLSAFSEESNGVTTKAVSEPGERMAAVVGFGGTLTVASSQEYSDLELRTVTAVAQLYIHSSLNTDRMLSLDILLDKSGFGADLMGDRLIGLSPPPPPSPASPTAVNSATTGTAVPTAVPSTRPAPPAPRTLGRKIASPCLGPVVTLSDTKQSLVIHVQEDITIIAWAGHHSPRKYDVNSEIVASKPLSGLKATNLKEFAKRVVYFERGDITLRDKVRMAAANGALGVVIGDNTGRCKNHEFTQVCVPGGDKRHSEGFAKTDPVKFWEEARLPVIIIEAEDASVLKKYILI